MSLGGGLLAPTHPGSRNMTGTAFAPVTDLRLALLRASHTPYPETQRQAEAGQEEDTVALCPAGVMGQCPGHIPFFLFLFSSTVPCKVFSHCPLVTASYTSLTYLGVQPIFSLSIPPGSLAVHT